MRRYNRWGGNPKGTPENAEHCVASVSSGWHSYQCCRKRGKGPGGLYCGIHARQIAQGRQPYVPKDE